MFTKADLLRELKVLQRYEHSKRDMEEDKDGDYVTYYDVLAMLEKLVNGNRPF